MNNNDKVAEEMMNLVLDVYRYARENNLDITSKEDMAKTLSAVGSEQTKSVDLNVLIEGLVAFEKMAKDEAAKRQKPESN